MPGHTSRAWGSETEKEGQAANACHVISQLRLGTAGLTLLGSLGQSVKDTSVLPRQLRELYVHISFPQSLGGLLSGVAKPGYIQPAPPAGGTAP